VTWRIPYFRHDLGEAELACVAIVLEGEILTTGDAVSEFEAKFATCLGVRHVLGVTSCTGALHMALLALGIGSGDEVITTPMSFVATATAILEAEQGMLIPPGWCLSLRRRSAPTWCGSGVPSPSVQGAT